MKRRRQFFSPRIKSTRRIHINIDIIIGTHLSATDHGPRSFSPATESAALHQVELARGLCI